MCRGFGDNQFFTFFFFFDREKPFVPLYSVPYQLTRYNLGETEILGGINITESPCSTSTLTMVSNNFPLLINLLEIPQPAVSGTGTPCLLVSSHLFFVSVALWFLRAHLKVFRAPIVHTRSGRNTEVRLSFDLDFVNGGDAPKGDIRIRDI